MEHKGGCKSSSEEEEEEEPRFDFCCPGGVAAFLNPRCFYESVVLCRNLEIMDGDYYYHCVADFRSLWKQSLYLCVEVRLSIAYLPIPRAGIESGCCCDCVADFKDIGYIGRLNIPMDRVLLVNKYCVGRFNIMKAHQDDDDDEYDDEDLGLLAAKLREFDSEFLQGFFPIEDRKPHEAGA